MSVLKNKDGLTDFKEGKVSDSVSVKANTTSKNSKSPIRCTQAPGSPQGTSQNNSCSRIPERPNDEYLKTATGKCVFTFSKDDPDLSVGSAGSIEADRVRIPPAEFKTSTYPYNQIMHLDWSIDPNRYKWIELRRQELLRGIYIDIPFGNNCNMNSQIVTPYSLGDLDEQNIYDFGSLGSPLKHKNFCYNIDEVSEACLPQEEKDTLKLYQRSALINNHMQSFPEFSQNMYQSDFQLSTQKYLAYMTDCNSREVNTLESHSDSEYYKRNFRGSNEYPSPLSRSSSKSYTFDEAGCHYSKVKDEYMTSKADDPAQPITIPSPVIDEIDHTPEGSDTEAKDSQRSKINTKESFSTRKMRVKWRPIIISEAKETCNSPTPFHESLDCTDRTMPLSTQLLDKYWKRSKDKKFFICMYKNCRQKLTRRYNVRSHVQMHFNDRHFACHLCPKRFVRRNDLNRHIRLHVSSSDSDKTAFTSIEGPVGPYSKWSTYETVLQSWHCI